MINIFHLKSANISKEPHKKNKLSKNRNKKKAEEPPYNKPFTDKELKSAIN